MLARRVSKSKSREATPAEIVESDSDDTKALPSLTSTPVSTPSGKKARLKKKLPEQQQDAGSAKKRRKRLSQTPEPSSSAVPPVDSDEELPHDDNGSQQRKQSSAASAGGQKRMKVSQQESPGRTKGRAKAAKTASRTPALKGQKNLQSRAGPTSKTPAGVHLSRACQMNCYLMLGMHKTNDTEALQWMLSRGVAMLLITCYIKTCL